MFKVIKYLIRKVSVVVNMSQEGLGVAALLTSFRPLGKVSIYYINRALVRFQWPALYKRRSLLLNH